MPSGKKTEIPRFTPRSGQTGLSCFNHIKKPGTQTQLRTAFRTEGLLSPSFTELEIMLRLLDDGMSAPLHRRIFEDKGLAYNIGAELEIYTDTGVLNIDATASHSNIDAILKETGAIIDDLLSGKLINDHLERVKKRAVFDTEAMVDYPEIMNNWFGTSELYGIAKSIEEECCKIESVTREDVAKVSKATFTSDRMQITTVGTLEADQQSQIEKSACSMQKV